MRDCVDDEGRKQACFVMGACYGSIHVVVVVADVDEHAYRM